MAVNNTQCYQGSKHKYCPLYVPYSIIKHFVESSFQFLYKNLCHQCRVFLMFQKHPTVGIDTSLAIYQIQFTSSKNKLKGITLYVRIENCLHFIFKNYRGM